MTTAELEALIRRIVREELAQQWRGFWQQIYRHLMGLAATIKEMMGEKGE